ncbi:MAG: hypothetical protein JXR94_14050 [Candidatus Hydrogenedentes bacterium]|nr:hypothetical protein [Candidatus Hydrogenedentota bacterium]
MHALLDPAKAFCVWCDTTHPVTILCRIPRYDLEEGEFRTELLCPQCARAALTAWQEGLEDVAPEEVVRAWNAWCTRQGVMFLEAQAVRDVRAACRLILAANGL